MWDLWVWEKIGKWLKNDWRDWSWYGRQVGQGASQDGTSYRSHTIKIGRYWEWLIVWVAMVFTASGQSLPWRLWESSSGPRLRQCMNAWLEVEGPVVLCISQIKAWPKWNFIRVCSRTFAPYMSKIYEHDLYLMVKSSLIIKTSSYIIIYLFRSCSADKIYLRTRLYRTHYYVLFSWGMNQFSIHVLHPVFEVLHLGALVLSVFVLHSDAVGVTQII